MPAVVLAPAPPKSPDERQLIIWLWVKLSCKRRENFPLFTEGSKGEADLSPSHELNAAKPTTSHSSTAGSGHSDMIRAEIGRVRPKKNRAAALFCKAWLVAGL